MKILVLGGAGYLGSMLTKKLLENNHKVTVVDNLRFNQGYYVADVLMHPNCIFRNEDVNKLDVKIASSHDIIYNLAALVGPICDKFPTEAQETNVNSIKRMIPEIGKYQKYCYLCSSSGYGSANKLCTEKDEMKSISLYAKTKEEAEKIVMNEIKCATSFRLATVWGRSLYHRLDLLVNDLTWQAVKNKKLDLFQGNHKRTYVHIDDVVNTLSSWRLDNRMGGEIYNIAGDNFDKAGLVSKLITYFPDLEVKISDKEDFDKRSYFICTKKIESLGYVSKKTVDNSLGDLIKFYQLIDENQENLHRMREETTAEKLSLSLPSQDLRLDISV